MFGQRGGAPILIPTGVSWRSGDQHNQFAGGGVSQTERHLPFLCLLRNIGHGGGEGDGEEC